MKTLLTTFCLIVSFVVISQPVSAGVHWVVLEIKFISSSDISPNMDVKHRGNSGFKSQERCEDVMRQKYLFDGYSIEKRKSVYDEKLVFKKNYHRGNYITATEYSCYPVFVRE